LSGAAGVMLLSMVPTEGEDLRTVVVKRTTWALFLLGASVLGAFLSGGLVLMIINRRPRD